MGINKNELTAEQVRKAMKCKDAAELMELAKNEGFDKGFRIVSNCGESAGQTVMHLHFHMMAGRDFGWPAG